MNDRRYPSVPGVVALAVSAAGILLSWKTAGPPIAKAVAATGAGAGVPVHVSVTAAVIVVAVVLNVLGLVVVRPNEAVVITLLGHYWGTVRRGGLRWVVPLSRRQKVSLRLFNFDSGILKVNDADGRPVDIAAVVTFKIIQPVRALFDVDNYQDFVRRQTEAILRHVAASRSYESAVDAESLRHSDSVAWQLGSELAAQVAVAGLGITETRLSHLAYAAEIAGGMLAKQQASAVIGARRQIVEGAVGIVDDALAQLDHRNIVLTPAARSSLAANLLVVLCSERQAQPVLDITAAP